MTLGVRGLVVDADRRIFLITHTYVPGWHLPGGGVEPGETLIEALARELVEEGNIEILEPPMLHGMFFNSRVSQRDHVALFVVRARSLRFTFQILFWLWITLLFANFAEAMAEGRGKAQAAALRNARTKTLAKRLSSASS